MLIEKPLFSVDETPKPAKPPKNYGVPYMGSKNKIAKRIIDFLPPAPVFVDLFAGGCAMTHAAMLSKKYQAFKCNDLDDAPKLFKDAGGGKYKNETRWVSREDFNALKDKDPYVRYLWSFGNRGKTYLYSKEIESYKKALHYALFFGEYNDLKSGFGFDLSPLDEIDGGAYHFKKTQNPTGANTRRALFKREILAKDPRVEYLGHGHYAFKQNGVLGELEHLQSLDSFPSLERLQSLESLGSLGSFGNLETSQKDYKSVDLPPAQECVIYCDPPYKNTTGYVGGDFDSDEFFDWAREKTAKGYKIFISEYNAPADFECVLEIPKRQLLNGQGAGKLVMEKLFKAKGGANA